MTPEDPDADLEAMDRETLLAAARAMRAAIRAHRDATGHGLCWHHPDMWALLPDTPKGASGAGDPWAITDLDDNAGGVFTERFHTVDDALTGLRLRQQEDADFRRTYCKMISAFDTYYTGGSDTSRDFGARALGDVLDPFTQACDGLAATLEKMAQTLFDPAKGQFLSTVKSLQSYKRILLKYTQAAAADIELRAEGSLTPAEVLPEAVSFQRATATADPAKPPRGQSGGQSGAVATGNVPDLGSSEVGSTDEGDGCIRYRQTRTIPELPEGPGEIGEGRGR